MTDSAVEKSGSFRRLERRRDKRTQIVLAGRIFCPKQNRETPCTLLDISPNGAAVESPSCVSVGDFVILYVEKLGRFEGHVIKRHNMRYSLRFNYTERLRKKIIDNIVQFLQGRLDEPARLRAEPRIYEPAVSNFTWSDGRNSGCEVADISLTGASLKTTARPPVNDVIQIGCSAARVVRYHEKGIAVEFLPGKSPPPPPVVAKSRVARQA